MLLGLYYTGSYVLKASKYIVKNVQKKIDGKCGHDCNKKLVKSSFGILGAFAELVMLSGAGSMIKKLAKDIVFRKTNVSHLGYGIRRTPLFSITEAMHISSG